MKANLLPDVPNVLEVPAHDVAERGVPAREPVERSVYSLEGDACCGTCAVERGVELYGRSHGQRIEQQESGNQPKPSESVQEAAFELSLRLGILFATGFDRFVHGETLAYGGDGGEAEMELWTLDTLR